MLTQKGGFSKEIIGRKDNKINQLYRIFKKVIPAVSGGFIHKENVPMVARERKREGIASNYTIFMTV